MKGVALGVSFCFILLNQLASALIPSYFALRVLRVSRSSSILSATRAPSEARGEASFEAFISALKVYRDLNGHIIVPGSFHVPCGDEKWPCELHGFRLGNKVARFRARARARVHEGQPQATLDDKEVSRLNDLGFVWDVKAHKFDSFCTLLESYRVLHGDVDVPFDFTVPLNGPGMSTWPQMHRGYRLGLRLYSVRQGLIFTGDEEKSALRERFGIVANERERKRSQRAEIKVANKTGGCGAVKQRMDFDTAYEAVALFKSKYGTPNVPPKFVVPHTDDNSGPPSWPLYMQGIPLYDVVKKWRRFRERLTEDQVKALERLGLQLDSTLMSERALILALKHYKRMHQSMSVPSRFRVPPMVGDASELDGEPSFTSSWPVETRGFALGCRVKDIQDGTWVVSESTAKWLSQAGFQWTNSRRRNFDLVCTALQAHEEFFGDMLVPRYFQVPSEEPWPRETWGIHLGNRVRNIRFGRAYSRPEHVAQLEDIGFFAQLEDYREG